MTVGKSVVTEGVYGIRKGFSFSKRRKITANWHHDDCDSVGSHTGLSGKNC